MISQFPLPSSVSHQPVIGGCLTCNAHYENGFWKVTRQCEGENCYCMVPNIVAGYGEFECKLHDPSLVDRSKLPAQACFLGLSCDDQGEGPQERVYLQYLLGHRNPIRLETQNWIVFAEYNEVKIPRTPVDLDPSPTDTGYTRIDVQSFDSCIVPIRDKQPTVCEIGKWTITLVQK